MERPLTATIVGDTTGLQPRYDDAIKSAVCSKCWFAIRSLWVLRLFAMEAKGRKKRTVFAALAVLAMGVAPLVNSLSNPRLAGLRGPEILQLTAIGFCVGLAHDVFLDGFLGGRG